MNRLYNHSLKVISSAIYAPKPYLYSRVNIRINTIQISHQIEPFRFLRRYNVSKIRRTDEDKIIFPAPSDSASVEAFEKEMHTAIKALPTMDLNSHSLNHILVSLVDRHPLYSDAHAFFSLMREYQIPITPSTYVIMARCYLYDNKIEQLLQVIWELKNSLHGAKFKPSRKPLHLQYTRKLFRKQLTEQVVRNANDFCNYLNNIFLCLVDSRHWESIVRFLQFVPKELGLPVPSHYYSLLISQISADKSQPDSLTVQMIRLLREQNVDTSPDIIVTIVDALARRKLSKELEAFVNTLNKTKFVPDIQIWATLYHANKMIDSSVIRQYLATYPLNKSNSDSSNIPIVITPKHKAPRYRIKGYATSSKGII